MFNRSAVIVFTNKQTDKQTNKQTPLETSTSLCYATPVGKNEINQLRHNASILLP